MPGLIANYRKQEVAARLKKFYSMFNQAIQLSQIDNGPVTDWSRTDNLNGEDEEDSKIKNFDEMSRFWNKYFSPYIKTQMIENGSDIGHAKIYLPDGSTILAWNGGCMTFSYDTNGDKKPNVSGKDIYPFHFCHKIAEQNRYLGINKAFGPLGMIDATDRQAAYDACKNNAICSSLLILYDNFEFKKDYPIKF